MSADNAVKLQSAQSTSDYDYQQSGSKYGVGVSYILVQLAPQLVEQLNALLAGGSPSSRDRTRSEFDRLKDDPSLTPEQKQQLQNLQSFYNAGVKAGYFTEPGGADTVVGGGGSATTPVVFAMAGVGATAAGTAAGAAAGAGLNGASGTNQGYRDPESGRWVGGSPPLTLPSLSSLEQLAATNPVIGPIYRAYAAMWEAIGASNNVYAVPSGEPPVPGATPGRPTSGRTSQWESSGGFDQANEDFDHLNPTDVRDYGNGVRVGTLPDGRSVVVRPTSSGERRPTLEIQGPRPIKVRY